MIPEGGGFLSSASPAMVCVVGLVFMCDEVERGLGSGFRTHVTGGLMALDEILTRPRLDGRTPGRSSAADGARDVTHVSDVILAKRRFGSRRWGRCSGLATCVFLVVE
ncbi:hypothetical protein F2Q69_00037872 [Brassica cretica]|uniref:Uncharacterized protein n=1 Tax=Brassica cretica TaxID=69181 RepID=A0A8S9R2H0_BRACR|nr:hypothetical protein F2Q69_00013987 [Brassica cretica]KAF3602814.1 hypothetical protein F2Q69_00037872 [Brassica cretica]